ncbi:MAG: DUF4832 domain-containing protein [Bacteroidales bacterium]|nr:DUF4832 domain-containing protein [Bacteroidales bacterium]
MNRLLLFATALFAVISCQVLPVDGQEPEAEEVVYTPGDGDTWVRYTEYTGHVINPERGFMSYADIHSKTSAITASAVKADRLLGRTLYYLGFYLTDFMNGDISQSYLDKIQSCFDALREGGAKCVLRFSYKNSESSKPWDAKEEVVMRHIEQIKPLLEKNKDVIFVLQAGFIGVWGEWYYTSNFNYQPSTDDDYLPRKRVAGALLAAVPDCRQIELRTPQFKMRLFGLSFKDTLTQATAHNGSPLSRIGSHNDCFGASKNDWGTFDNEPGDRQFWKAETRYTIMGGETCNVSDYCTCEASLTDMEDYHWTYLNRMYNTDVIDRWVSSGCMDEITDRLGYRLVLKSVVYTPIEKKGDAITMQITLENVGFAAPMNPRKVYMVFVDGKGNVTKAPVKADPRDWHPGRTTVFNARIIAPANEGTVYLELPDPLLMDRPEYSIALANNDIFNAGLGYNKLFDINAEN